MVKICLEPVGIKQGFYGDSDQTSAFMTRTNRVNYDVTSVSSFSVTFKTKWTKNPWIIRPPTLWYLSARNKTSEPPLLHFPAGGDRMKSIGTGTLYELIRLERN